MKVGIVGANGYGGAELIRLLRHHPNVTLELLISHSTQGQSMTDQYGHMQDIVEMPLEKMADHRLDDLDILFFATPAGVAKKILPAVWEKGITCIDLSGDFRLTDGDVYEKWYKKDVASPAYLEKAVYGLPELNRQDIKGADFIANPGCYPTAALLGMLPILQAELLAQNASVIIDGKTGVSGAGRNVNIENLFTEMNDNTKAYKLANHQHTPEIEQTMSRVLGHQQAVTFAAHLIPMTRGILCTLYLPLAQPLTNQDVSRLYQDYYQNEPFVRVKPEGKLPTTKEVYGSNYCDIGLTIDPRTNMLMVVSVIDNLVKGAAGQAIQNMNLLHNWDEKTGLDMIPVYP